MATASCSIAFVAANWLEAAKETEKTVKSLELTGS
jgi:hypothetical protein